MTIESKNYAMLFPGQGSQERGMGQDLYDHDEATRQLFFHASNTLGYSLEDLCFLDPKEVLSGKRFDTSKVQPALLLVSIATSRFLQRNGVPTPSYLLGHSAGKIAALVESGAIDLDSALRFMPRRGQAIKSLKKPDLDPVVAIVTKLDWDTVTAILREVAHLAPSFLPTVENNSGQIVIGGLREHFDYVVEAINRAKGKVREYSDAPLSHHTLLQKAQERLNRIKLGITHPSIPTVDDLTGRLLQTVGEIENSLTSHLVEPLRFRLGVESVYTEHGLRLALESGPKNVLAGIINKDYPKFKVLSTATFADIENTISHFR